MRSISIKGVWKIVFSAGFMSTAFAALMLSCNSNNSTTAPTERRSWYYEYEFEQDSELVARPNQVVILEIMPGEELVEHEIPYQYENGRNYLFGIDADDPFISRVEILDRSGVLLAQTERGDGGVYLNMTPGGYHMKVYHEGADVPKHGSAAFIRQQETGQAQRVAVDNTPNDANSAPVEPAYPAYGALRIVGGDHDGQYVAIEPGLSCGGYPYTLLKAIPIEGNDFKDQHHLFSFKNGPGCCFGDIGGGPYPTFAGSCFIYPFSLPEDSVYLFMFWYLQCSDCPSLCPPSQKRVDSDLGVWVPSFLNSDEGGEWSSSIQDMGDGSMRLWACTYCSKSISPLYVAENGYLYWTQYSNGKEADGLTAVDGFRFYRDGSQIKREHLVQGEVALYAGENYTGVAVVLSASFSNAALISMDQIRSVAFGPYTDTTVQFFGKVGFPDSDLIKTVGVDMPNNLDLDGGSIASIKIFDSKKILIASKKCPHCNLAGVDLSTLSLDGADMSYANLRNANMHQCSLKKADLSMTLFNGATLTNANLEGASLLNALLNSDTALNLASANLTGAYLQNANCKGADLGGVDFINASFHTSAIGYTGDACSQNPDTPFTRFCASAEGANMDGTNFNGAYLAGTDFSGATAIATNFSEAVLTGALFREAHLDWDENTGESTDFTGAFIGGADFSSATVESAVFQSAYVNLSAQQEKLTLYFALPSTHTRFPGFNAQIYGNEPCVQFINTHPTIPPVTTSRNTCPNGSKGPCGDGAWTSPATKRDQSSWTNSQGPDQPDWCKNIDWEW